MIVQLVDEREWLRGFIVEWIRALAARVDRLDVLTLEQGQADLPDNVFVQSMGKERGYGRLREALGFIRGVGRVVREVDVVITHMTPRFTWMAWPQARRHRKPLMMWFTHRQISPDLRLADRCATHILTASANSYPLPSSKVHVMGHGVQTDLFPAASGEAHPPAVALVARLSSIKRQDWLLRAASQVMRTGQADPFRVVCVGGDVDAEAAYADALRALPAQLDPSPDVTFTGPLAHADMAAVLRDSAISVNLSPPGLFDKGALEAMLAGKPSLVTNTDFLPLLGEDADLLYLPPDAGDDALADRLARLLALSPAERAAIGGRLRERALAAHSLDGLMDRMVALMREAVHG
jgi:glycosyltransferase involved in cell wall biosynthesis